MQAELQPDLRQTTEPIEQMLAQLGVKSVFGEPRSEGGATIIPVAQISCGFGYGGGYGRSGEAPAPETTEGEKDEGGGSGAGGGGQAKPCGYIRITADGVTFQPITDETRIPIAGILFAAWAVFWVMLTIRTITKAVAKTRQAKHKRAAG
jgi:uncharacterized spore protein YtfJ